MMRFVIFCHAWFLHSVQIHCSENAWTVIRFSVPEDHHVRLPCGDSDSSDAVWTHRDGRVPVTLGGDYETDEDSQRYLLLPDGSLRLLRLNESDSGEYRCNRQLVAELQVLSGHDYTVSAGWTLLLPCSGSFRSRQRWFHWRDGGKREVIFTWFKNGTIKPERDGSRFSYENDALQIQDLQLEDAGLYQCNKKQETRVTVFSLRPEPTSLQQCTSTTSVITQDALETKRKEKKKRSKNVLLLVAVVSLGLMVLLLAALCVSLTCMKCRRKKNSAAASKKHEDAELQPWRTSDRQTESEFWESPSLSGETLHYASLGRQNWRERPSRTVPDQNHCNVIYSSVITTPAATESPDI